jgi:type IV pilus assembly protein PilY1
MKHLTKTLSSSGLAAILLVSFFSAPAKALNISDLPLYLAANVDPNLMFILDDSGSMQWEHMPDQTQFFTVYTFPLPAGTYGGTGYTNQVPDHQDNNLHNFFSRSSANNSVFYNPDITYQPWIANNGAVMPNADPLCPLYNPALPALGCLAITTEVTQFALWFWNITDQNQNSAFGANANHTYWPISYYNYLGGDRRLRTSYNRVQITSATPASDTFTSPGGIVRTRDEEIQNFANWFQYYRSRVLAARAGIGRAFSTQPTNMRVGFGTINTGALTIDGETSNSTLVRGARPFSGTNRSDFYDSLYNQVINQSGTPLRRALNQAGLYYSRTDNAGPWGAVPGTNNTTSHLECRQSYTILMTDGFWNGPAPAVENADNTNGQVIANPITGETYQYTPTDPYRDQWSNTLADVAMQYWKTDLRTTLANKVPVTPENPAFWQHMVTFGVGLGVQGSINPDTAWAAVTSGTPIAWLDPSLTNPAKLDDLLHAAINGHGGFFSAADPNTFATELSSILSAITERTEASSAAVTTNSTRLDTNSVVYQAKFDSRNWTGQLLAFPVNSNGSLASTASWDAGQRVTAQGSLGRSIFSFNPSTNLGVSFNHANLVTSLTEDQINYLRGDQSEEQPSGAFRKRTGNNALFGDIVNSDPWFIGGTNFGYHLLKPNTDGSPTQEATDYVTYRSSATYRARTPLVIVGANDGMLHAFNAKVTGTGNGDEVFAYVPHTILNALDALTDPAYTHKYFVDGPPIAADAYFDADNDNDKEWRTVAVGTLGAGGKGVFALDVTFLDPGDNTYQTAETAFSAERVLWEINSSKTGFTDLGFTLGQASIVRMANGEYAAIFGNGYNSTNHKAVLYIVNIKTGALIKSINTNVGTATAKNGLSTPIAVDVNGDRVVDAIYAGDLQGNMWKFDVSSSNPDQWDEAFGNNTTPRPLYQAKTAGNVSQPITGKPQVGKHPTSGVMVYFGTGKYFETGDHTVGTSPLVHTFYGIWDTCVKVAGVTGNCPSTFPNTNRSNLVAQTILLEGVFTVPTVEDEDEEEPEEPGFNIEQNVRVSSNNTVDYATKKGWYMDLVSPPSATAKGERVVSQALLRGGRIIFTTLIPDDNPCASGGTSWLMELDSLTGRRIAKSPFDLTGNNLINSEDLVLVEVVDGVYSIGTTSGVKTAVSGIQSNVGIIKTPGVISAGDLEYKYTSGSTGAMEVTTESVSGSSGRQSWRQLR